MKARMLFRENGRAHRTGRGWSALSAALGCGTVIGLYALAGRLDMDDAAANAPSAAEAAAAYEAGRSDARAEMAVSLLLAYKQGKADAEKACGGGL